MAQAASFRERVTIYTSGATVENAFGRKPAGLETSLETWAAVQQLQAKVYFEDGKTEIKRPFKVIIRYVNDPTVQYTNRVEWNGIKLTVQSVVTDAKKTTTTLYCFGD